MPGREFPHGNTRPLILLRLHRPLHLRRVGRGSSSCVESDKPDSEWEGAWRGPGGTEEGTEVISIWGAWQKVRHRLVTALPLMAARLLIPHGLTLPTSALGTDSRCPAPAASAVTLMWPVISSHHHHPQERHVPQVYVQLWASAWQFPSVCVCI